MDLGGTNLRVMLMDIMPGEELKMEQFNTRVPNWAMRGTGEQVDLYPFQYFVCIKNGIFVS